MNTPAFEILWTYQNLRKLLAPQRDHVAVNRASLVALNALVFAEATNSLFASMPSTMKAGSSLNASERRQLRPGFADFGHFLGDSFSMFFIFEVTFGLYWPGPLTKHDSRVPSASRSNSVVLMICCRSIAYFFEAPWNNNAAEIRVIDVPAKSLQEKPIFLDSSSSTFQHVFCIVLWWFLNS